MAFRKHCRRCAVAGLVFTASLFLAGVARPMGSSPVLAITNASTLTAPGGVRSVIITGTFNFDDVLQFSFPAGMIITQGAHFVRYDLSGGLVEGTSAIAAAGITALDIPTLLTLGSAAGSPAGVTQLRVDRISVALPADFTPGAASVILYAVLETDPFVSNTLAVTLP